MRAMAHRPAARCLLALVLSLGLAEVARAEAQPERARTRAQAQPAQLAPSVPSPARTADVPPLLSPWIAWVLEDAGDLRCPQVGELRVCVWPSSLAVQVLGNAASFTLRVTTERDGLVQLPGSSAHWPIDVEVDGHALPVLQPNDVPTVHVTRGVHTIVGRFLFGEAPTTLQTPANVGALSLQRDGVAIAHPKREPSGLVWIEESAANDERAERLTLSVHRRIEDAVPLRVVTRILVSASGKPREIVFDSVLLSGARPIELRADLPAQLSATGSLRMQAQGGSYRVEIVSILERPVTELVAPKQPAPWPDHEAWLFKADDQLRHVELKGPPQVDSARTDLESDWRGLPTFLLAPGQTLSFETRRRGEPEPAKNRLTLERSLWLDLDGDGYTIRDRLSGTMHQGFRLDLAAGTLGRAVVDGTDELITRRDKLTGVELRKSRVDVATEWRIEHGRSQLPAVGYSEDIDNLSAVLHLPPGFMLLGAQGADLVRGTWLDSWDLFDFFFVLLISLAVYRLAGAAFGLTALLALVLTQHEPSSPGVTWIFLLSAAALQRALLGKSYEKLARLLFAGALLVLLLALVPFMVEQIRTALYPQLAETAHVENEWTMLSGGFAAMPAPEEASAPERDEEGEMGRPQQQAEELRKRAEAPSAAAAEAELLGAMGRGGLGSADSFAGGAVSGRLGVTKNKYAIQSYAPRELVDPNAIVQTGPGLPSWRFREFALHWSGPVERSERVQLWLLPPSATRLWSLASALLSGVLLFALLRVGFGHDPRGPRPPRPNSNRPIRRTDITVTVLAALLASAPGLARAQAIPSADLLHQLRTRLLAAPTCAPSCVAVPSLSLALGDKRLDIRAEVHAGEGAVYRAPGPLESWAIDRVRVDGADALAAARLDDGFLHVRVPPGIHTIELSGPVPPHRASTLALGGPTPHRVEAHGRGWVIEGLHADGTSEASLELRREVSTSSEPGDGEQALTQWLEVRRELELGLRFQVRTTVTRLGPAHESALLRLPLLPGESVTEAGLNNEAGSVVITLPRDERAFSFVSTIAPQSRIELVAAQPTTQGVLVHPYSESWLVRPSTLYRVRFEGLAPVTQLGPEGRFEPLYRPWPGEKLTVFAERLEAALGASVTIDAAELRFRPGSRIEETKLTLSVRASRGTTEHITLPRDATLTALEIDGRAHPARLKQGALELPLDPGSHRVALTATRPYGLSFRYAPVAPKIGRSITNLHISIAVPEERWLLATRGPAWGPAILWWGYVIMVLLVAVALGRARLSPLRPFQWALLGLGLTQVAPVIALFVVGWLFALAYREQYHPDARRLFYLVQVMLVFSTVGALGCLAYAVHQGLLVSPDMQVQGMLSNHNFVQWYADRTPGDLPHVTLWTAPVWIYKALMLLWALWLAISLIQWLRWGWAAFRKGGPRNEKPPRGSGPVDPSARSKSDSSAPGGGPPDSANSERARVS